MKLIFEKGGNNKHLSETRLNLDFKKNQNCLYNCIIDLIGKKYFIPIYSLT